MTNQAKQVSLAIALCGILITISTPLLAQEGARPLILRKGNKEVVIPIGDWVVATDSTGKVVLASGRHVNRGDSVLNIMSPERPEQLIPYDEIGVLYHGEAKRIGYYTKRGLVSGAKWGAIGYSAILLPIIVESGSSIIEGVAFAISLGAYAGGLFGVYIGVVNGYAKSLRAKKYLIGPGQWEIVRHTSIDIES